MSKKPKKKRKLPKDLKNKPSAEIAERLFGKKAKAELDRIAKAAVRKSIQG